MVTPLSALSALHVGAGEGTDPVRQVLCGEVVNAGRAKLLMLLNSQLQSREMFPLWHLCGRSVISPAQDLRLSYIIAT